MLHFQPEGSAEGCSCASETLPRPELFCSLVCRSHQPHSLWKPLSTGHPFLQCSRGCGPPWTLQASALQSPKDSVDCQWLRESHLKARGHRVPKLTWASSRRAKGRAELIGTAAEELWASDRLGGRGMVALLPQAKSAGLSDSTSAWAAGQGRRGWGRTRAE